MLFSHHIVSDSLQTHGLQHTRLPCPSPSPGVHSNSIGDAIQPSHALSPSSPCLSLSQHQDRFQWVSSLHQMAKVLEVQLQHQSFQRLSGLISFRINCFDLLAVHCNYWHAISLHVYLSFNVPFCSWCPVLPAYSCSSPPPFLHLFWVNQAFLVYLLLAVPGLRCSWAGFLWLQRAGTQTLNAQASVVSGHRLSSCGMWAELLRSMWISPDQGSNPCPLHWQTDSYPL